MKTPFRGLYTCHFPPQYRPIIRTSVLPRVIRMPRLLRASRDQAGCGVQMNHTHTSHGRHVAHHTHAPTTARAVTLLQQPRQKKTRSQRRSPARTAAGRCGWCSCAWPQNQSLHLRTLGRGPWCRAAGGREVDEHRVAQRSTESGSSRPPEMPGDAKTAAGLVYRIKQLCKPYVRV